MADQAYDGTRMPVPGGTEVVRQGFQDELEELWARYLAPELFTAAPPAVPETAAPRPPSPPGLPPSASPPLPTLPAPSPQTPVDAESASPPPVVAPAVPAPPSLPGPLETEPADQAPPTSPSPSYRDEEFPPPLEHPPAATGSVIPEIYLPPPIAAEDSAIFDEVLSRHTIATPDQREASAIFDEILSRPRTIAIDPQVSAFAKLMKLPRRALAKVFPIADAIGPLGVILPTVLFPDEERRREEAQAEAELERAEIEGLRRGRVAANRDILPPWTPAPSEIRNPAPRAKRRGRGAPPAPPTVPQLPGLSPEQLSKVLGEPSASAFPDVVGPAADEVSSVSRLPVRQARRRPLLSPLPRVATGSFRLPFADQTTLSGPSASPAPIPRPDVPTPSGPFEPFAPPLPSPLPRPLTTLTNPLLSSPPNRECECQRPTPNPSDKVPTVRSYKRRMSRNSLDNLRRG